MVERLSLFLTSLRNAFCCDGTNNSQERGRGEIFHILSLNQETPYFSAILVKHPCNESLSSQDLILIV